MSQSSRSCLALCACCAVAAPVHGTGTPGTVDEIVVIGHPIERTVEQLAQPTSVVDSDRLVTSQSASIGETLADEPGVSATYFGPVASRPVIRGQFGERVRVLSNGLDALDASALSEDHAVSVDAIIAERVEIVRGPATLLYGSGAAGGLVNVVDSRIHERRGDERASGAVSLGVDSATGRRNGAFAYDLELGPAVLHFDLFHRTTDDVEIPGYAESARLRALEADDEEGEDEDEAFGVVKNTDSEAAGGGLGASWIGQAGFVGVSVGRFNTNYGVPVAHGHEAGEPPDAGADRAVRIDLDQTRYDIKGQWNTVPGLEHARYHMARNDYRHVELEGAETGTVFDTRGTDLRVELRHFPIRGFDGAFGVQYKHIDFDAIGDEAFVPGSETHQVGLFAFEEISVRDTLALQFSTRAEWQQIETPAAPDYDDWAFGASVGAVWRTDGPFGLSANLAFTERHPNATELYADGPHLAVQRFERGSTTLGAGLLGKERSTNLDVTLRGVHDASEFSITAFVNSVDDYIVLEPTAGDEDGLQVFDFGRTDVTMYGFEAGLSTRLVENGRHRLTLDLKSDLVFGENDGTGAYLPRLTPRRIGAGFDYGYADWLAVSVEATRNEAQKKTAANELPTDAFTLVDAQVSAKRMDGRLLLFLKGTNLTDTDARRHTSAVKDIVPLPGRSVHAGLRWDF